MATLLAMRTGIQERVRVESLSVVGEIGEGDVEKEDEDQHGETEEWVRGGGWEDDFRQGVEGVEAVLGDLIISLISL